MKRSLLIFLSLFVLNCSHSKPSASQAESDTEASKEEVGVQVEDRQKIFRLAIISDLNGSYGSKTYSTDVSAATQYLTDPENKIDFILSTGDMVAGQKSNLDYAGMWEAFHKVVTRPLLKANIPFYPSPGNHDAYIGREIERKHYRNTWDKEKPLLSPLDFAFVSGVEQNFPFQYAFKRGGALFISLDNTDVKPWSQSTLKWIEQVLEKEKGSPVKFVFGHVPLLPFAFKKETEYVAKSDVGFLNSVEKLFEKYKVDVFFSGHSHVYYPGRRDLHTEYISVPLLGSGTRYLITKSENEPRSQRGFLILEYNDKGEWSLEHRHSESFELVADTLFPEALDMPSQNTSKCKRCTQFPKSHFLDSTKRIIYRRRDL